MSVLLPDDSVEASEPFRCRLEYNHAHEYRSITRTQVDKVKAKKSSEWYLSLAKL